MTSFYLQMCKFTNWMNYLYLVNSIWWKFELINKIFLQILFTKLFLAKFIRFEILKSNLFFFFTIPYIFFFIVRCYLLRRTQWIAFLTVKIIYYYKLLTKMICSMKNYLMIYMLVLIFWVWNIAYSYFSLWLPVNL